MGEVLTLKSPLTYTGEDTGIAYRFIQDLKNSKKFKSKLEQFDILAQFSDYSRFENSRQFALDGENYNVNRLIENTKKFFIEENIPYILNYHFENFDKLNKIFTETLKIQLSSRMQEETDLKVFKEEMFKTIHDSYLSFPNDEMFDFFSGKSQNFYYQSERNFNGKNASVNSNAGNTRNFNQTTGQFRNYSNNRGYSGYRREYDCDGKVDMNRIKFCLFFGDNKKIKLLIQIIDSKLFLLMKNRLQQGQQGTISKIVNESKYSL